MPRSARRHCGRHTCPPPPGSFIHGDGLPPLPYPYRRCHHPPCLFCLVRHYLYQQDAASVVRANKKERRKRAMSGAGGEPGAVAADAVAVECYFCGGAAAVVYCRADAAALCLACDRQVHGANTVSCRHARAPLCAACRAAAATVRRGAARFLCSNCDFEKQQQEEEHGELTQPPPLHDGGAVESYTGCPSAGELAAILGVAGDKAAEAWWPSSEEPQVLTFDDVLLETTSCHGLRPLLTSSSPKSRSPPGGELDGEVLRQLAELAKSEEAATYVEDTEPAGVDQLPPWESSDYDIGHGDLGALGAEAIACVAASLHIPSCQHHEARIATDCHAAAQQEQVSASSSAEPSQTSFVELSEVCPGLSRSGSSADDVRNGGGHDHPSPAPVTPVQPAQAPKNVGGYDVVYPDRDRVISRYKEKRKNRIFGKQIRYESRKARADGRVRINGRFAKTS